MNTTRVLCGLAAALACTSIAFAGGHEKKEKQRPSFYASQSATINAAVEAINHETRDVTLKLPDGSAVSFVASEEARNLDQVSVGDVVTTQYVEELSIQVVANEGMEPDEAELGAMARTEKGQMPGVAAMETQIVTATVEDINIEANTFKLRYKDGQVQEYVARNPENLKRADVGDLVVFTATKSFTLVVTPGADGPDSEST